VRRKFPSLLDINMNVVQFMNMVHKSEVPGGTRREQAKAQRLRDITRTAMDILRRNGLEALTIHTLAQHLQLSVGALYLHFPSKESLLAELETMALQVLYGQMVMHDASGRRTFRGHTAPLSRLIYLGHVYAAFFDTHPAEAGLLGQLLANPQIQISSTSSEGKALLSTVINLLGSVSPNFEEAVDAGILAPGDPLERTVLYWSGLRGVLELRKLQEHRPDFNPMTLFNTMIRTLLLGFGATPSALRTAFTVFERSSATLLKGPQS
jgi:AcrR family transcriptional regulator